MEKIPETIEFNVKYIICPDMTCNGFWDEQLRCEINDYQIELFPELNLKKCPHQLEAKKVVFCASGHPIEELIISSNWTRSECNIDNCYGITFSKMSNKIIRIPLEQYNEFLKKPVNNK